MLKKFEIRNYKNFKDTLTIDFDDIGGYQFNTNCLFDNMISKMLLYGRNATGKTNLGSAILDIALSPFTLIHYDFSTFLNADSSEDSAKFLYIFKFNNDLIEYSYEKQSMSQYTSEKLVLNNITIFDFNYSINQYNFENLDKISAETIIVDRFIQAKNEELSEETETEPIISFLRWLFANAVFPADSSMNEMRNYISKMRLITISSLLKQRIIARKDVFFETLEGENLKNLEDFLNGMGVECELETKKLPDGQHELYFKKKKLVPFFENASSGTLVLFNIYRRIIPLMQNISFCYLDEFDAFFHYEMSERFLNYFKEKFPKCQMIYTTHNTNLMSNSLMRPDCLFILSRKGKVTPLNKATRRELREGHNLEKMYISGEFKEHE